MAQTLKFGNKVWAAKEDSVLAYNDINNNYKPLPFSFSRASIGTRVNKDGIIETMGQDIARIDYTDSADGVLLLEPSRTNLIAYSEDFTNGWILDGVTVLSDNLISPDGSLNADKITFVSGNERLYYIISTSSAVFSLYLKGENGKEVRIRDASGFIANNITLTDKWERYDVFINQSNSNIQIENINSEYVYTWGAQLEEGSYPTSYIPTSGSTLTRAAETCNNSGNSEVFNDSEGVLFGNIAAFANDGTSRRLSVSDGTTSNRVEVLYGTISDRIDFQVTAGGSFQGSGFGLINADNFSKVALKYKVNDLAFWVNGFEVATDINATMPSGLDTMRFEDAAGSNDFYGKTKEIGYYNTALTDLELETLTSYRNWVSMVNELNLNIIYNG